MKRIVNINDFFVLSSRFSKSFSSCSYWHLGEQMMRWLKSFFSWKFLARNSNARRIISNHVRGIRKFNLTNSEMMQFERDLTAANHLVTFNLCPGKRSHLPKNLKNCTVFLSNICQKKTKCQTFWVRAT